MLNELLRHIRCKRLEAERANACGTAASRRGQNRGMRAHEFLRKASQLDFCSAASRSTILKQFNAILETRDTPDGLVAILADELFDKFTLRPVAREKLRRVTHLLLRHPGMRLGVEVHTNGRGPEQKG